MEKYVKRIIGFIAVLAMTYGCKDIEKNPSGCDYGYVTNNNGECLSNSFTAGLKIQAANKNLYNRLFIKSYTIPLSESRNVKWNTGAIASALSDDQTISSYVEFVITKEKLSEIAFGHHKEMEAISASTYEDGVDRKSVV